MERLVLDVDGNALQEGQRVSTILGGAYVSSLVHYPAFSAVQVRFPEGGGVSLNGDDVRLHGDHPQAPEGI